MGLEFYKYQATGNDFVIIDDRKNDFDVSDYQLVNRLCDRKFGVGADGLMLLRSHKEYDFEMVYFNADGHEGSMCGNGGRALVKFAQDLGVIQDSCKFIAVDGEHDAFIEDGLVHLHMIDVANYKEASGYYFMDTGSPHHVEFIEGTLSDFDVYTKGKEVRESDLYAPNGTNVNFVEKLSSNKIRVRTFERGVEDETLSCGTGVTACALSSFLAYGAVSPLNIQVEGGELSVSFENDGGEFKEIFLIGPAAQVFTGVI